MIPIRLSACVFAGVLLTVACGGGNSSPTSPSQPTPNPAPAPAPTLYTIRGQVTSAGGGGIAGATVRVADGPNAGMTTGTDGGGNYSLTGLTFAGFTVEASAPGYVASSRGGILSPGVTSATANFSLLPAVIWSKSGTGDTAFDMPTYIKRVRIIADYGSSSSNFIVHIAGAHIVNELMGTYWGQTHFDGTYAIAGGGLVETLSSSGVRWSMTEVR